MFQVLSMLFAGAELSAPPNAGVRGAPVCPDAFLQNAKRFRSVRPTNVLDALPLDNTHSIQ
jgi:hypothetical protein